MAGTEYGKVWSPFRRETEGPDRGKLLRGQWARAEFELLAQLPWTWTEKVNGTNVRIIWDGHRVRFGGRTDEASMPIVLLDRLTDMFPEELLEQQFGATPVVLYGEGYGAKVSPGSGVYRSDPGFVMFDARVDTWWLLPPALTTLGLQMGVDVTPAVFTATIGEALDLVCGNGQVFTSVWGDFTPEGLVGKPPLGLLGRDGDRLMMKLKAKDFR